MQKKYVVRLTEQERDELRTVVKKLKGTSQKVRRAQILLKADADGPGWTDEWIAEAFLCRTRTVERLRQRLVERGFDETLHRVERAQPPVEKLLTGVQEARIIATRLGSPWLSLPAFANAYRQACRAYLSAAVGRLHALASGSWSFIKPWQPLSAVGGKLPARQQTTTAGRLTGL